MVGKYGSNAGQACISPDYVLVEEHFAPTLVHVFILVDLISGFVNSSSCSDYPWRLKRHS